MCSPDGPGFAWERTSRPVAMPGLLAEVERDCCSTADGAFPVRILLNRCIRGWHSNSLFLIRQPRFCMRRPQAPDVLLEKGPL